MYLTNCHLVNVRQIIAKLAILIAGKEFLKHFYVCTNNYTTKVSDRNFMMHKTMWNFALL